jgi:hypothetical protein
MGCGWIYRKGVGICTRRIKRLGNQSQAWGREDTAFFRKMGTGEVPFHVQCRERLSQVEVCALSLEKTFFFLSEYE